MAAIRIPTEAEEEIVVNKYALLIGVEEFISSGISPLRGVNKDISNFQRILNNREVSNFHVTTLLNPGIIETKKAISDISWQAKRDDVVFFYFAGHGTISEEKDFFMILHDSEPKYLEATCLSSEYVLSQFKTSSCRNFILVVDSCHSGAFFNNNRGLPSGLFTLTACDENQNTTETQDDGGVFSHLLVKGLESDYIDANRDGKITFSELFDYIIDEMKYVSSQTRMGTPKKWEWNVEKDICLFDSPRPIFISYQRGQKELVAKISQSLQEQDIVTFVDQEKIRLGDNWRDLLEKTIKNSRVFLFILDTKILSSKVANWELEVASKHSVPILPVVVEDVEVHAMFEARYGQYNRFLFNHEEFDSSVKTIVDHIKAIRIRNPRKEEPNIPIATR